MKRKPRDLIDHGKHFLPTRAPQELSLEGRVVTTLTTIEIAVPEKLIRF